MKKLLLVLAANIVPFIPVGTTHAETTSKPTLVPSNSSLYTYDVSATVTVGDSSTITLVTTAYRHPATVQARLIVDAGTYEIRDVCKPFRLPTTWTLYVNNIRIASSILKCA